MSGFVLGRLIMAGDIATALGFGVAGQILTSKGPDINPAWSDSPSAELVDLANVTGTLTIVPTLGNSVYKGVLTGDVTFNVTTTHVGFGAVLIAFTQGAGGGFDIAFPDNFRWQGGFSPSLQTVPGATDLLQLLTFDGGATWFAAIVMQAAP